MPEDASERRFYQSLLALSDRPCSERALDEALSSIVAVTKAELALLELFDEQQLPRYWRGCHVNEESLDTIRSLISREIVAHVVSARETLETRPMAGGEVVLCVPIVPLSVSGILYVQRSGPFASIDGDRAELFAAVVRNLPVFDAGPPRTNLTLHEQTQALWHRLVREALWRCDRNISKAARELGVSRAFIYNLMSR